MDLYRVDSDEAMKQGNEASERQRFIVVTFKRKTAFYASSPLLFKRNSSLNASSLLLLKITLPTSVRNEYYAV